MREELEQAIVAVCKDLFNVDVDVELTRPDEQFGDYATNVALQLGKQLNKNPREIAEELTPKLHDALKEYISNVTVAGPGFVNLTLTDSALTKLAEEQPRRSLEGKTVVAEYSDPNPFKVLHAGHLYTSIVGDAIANLLETTGAIVHRVNFGGDVGLHVAKTMWSILWKIDGDPNKLDEIPEEERANWMAEEYVRGSLAYGEQEETDAEIVALNKKIYQIHANNDHDSQLAQIYWKCRQWSYDYFDKFYAQIGSHFEKYYPESETSNIGLKTVKQQIGKVFIESDGAVVFKGDDYGLHTRVFINSEGLPTYEAKDIGLIMKKWQDYHFDKSIVVTGNEQAQYMAVVLKAVEQFMPELAHATTHLTHGMVKLAGGEKMSSRKGNILRAVDVLEAAAEANKTLTGNEDEQVVLAAVKYAFLKQRIGGDIIYDPAESVALEGNSGPYVQYAHARARSILNKANVQATEIKDLQADERTLLRKISEYTEVVDKAVQDLLPSHITTYLYELAQVFNRFYENNRVIDDEREQLRLQLVQKYAETLKSGLELLNIPAPERM